LVNVVEFLSKESGVLIKQGYLSTDSERTIRARIYGNNGFVTIKGKTFKGSRLEYEYEIPLKDAEEIISKLCSYIVEKVRYKVQFSGHVWEVDVFLKDNEGLVIAEIELNDINERYDLPNWLDYEITNDYKYSNSNLAVNPYKRWE
jgi:adenylate cyclase